MQPTACIQD